MDRVNKVVVIIPNWNGEQYLEPCLRSVLAQDFDDFAVVVVDNGSSDGSISLIKEKFPEIFLIENRRNLGFAVANNQAVHATHSEFVATLNNDTEVEPGWLSALAQTLSAHPEVGMCASKMVLKDERGIVDSTGVSVDRAGMIWNREGGALDLPETPVPVPVFGVCAGAALYRRAMLDEIGLFDEDFFAYLEDVDLSWRAQWAGWGALYVPQARVLHVHSATGGRDSYFKSWLLGRNKLWLLVKNYPFPTWLVLFMLFYECISVVYACLHGRGSGALSGRWAAYKHMPVMLKKRRRMVRRIGRAEMVRLLAPVQNPLSVLQRYLYLR